MSSTKEQDRGPKRPAGRDPAAPHDDGAVPRTTEDNREAADGKRFEKVPNPGHPV
ncbi:hypothetical protein JHL17_13960 [Azospirillum sp. YIM B02556]|uniref:Uncharacterized protein n=1 Tax=Azospirillum endophyticum TaxID=2800326 RepID=A0ABS1F521_9PROT|nr:hypothetical protein [Azospirillum endophyticum]MBK1838521.1 hypothetical protein [Azospirillum endophyticum]